MKRSSETKEPVHSRCLYKNFARAVNSDRSDCTKFPSFKNKQLCDEGIDSERNSAIRGHGNKAISSSINITYLNNRDYTNNHYGLDLQEAELLYSCFFKSDNVAIMPNDFGDDGNKRTKRQFSAKEKRLMKISISSCLPFKKRSQIESLS